MVVLEPYRAEWATHFAHEADAVRTALGEVLLELHHIGSTAIPGIVAKPIIDMLAVVRDVALLDRHAAALVAFGYESKGAFGIPGRRYFRRNDAAGVRTHHLHAFAIGSIEIEKHLRFRDYLRAHPADAQAYASLKRELARRCAGDGTAYTDGKSEFIANIDQRATLWRTTHE